MVQLAGRTVPRMSCATVSAKAGLVGCCVWQDRQVNRGGGVPIGYVWVDEHAYRVSSERRVSLQQGCWPARLQVDTWTIPGTEVRNWRISARRSQIPTSYFPCDLQLGVIAGSD